MDHACDTYSCTADQEFLLVCPQYIKGPADIDCHLPCLIRNCSVLYLYETICILWSCEPNPGPVPPTPVPPTPVPPVSSTPKPEPSLPMDLATIIFSVGGKIYAGSKNLQLAFRLLNLTLNLH